MFRSLHSREAGIPSASNSIGFQREFGRSLDLLHRLKLDKRLEGHEGCVNTVAFTPSGDGLVSGSDDLDIKFWNWQTGLHVFHGSASPRKPGVHPALYCKFTAYCLQVQ